MSGGLFVRGKGMVAMTTATFDTPNWGDAFEPLIVHPVLRPLEDAMHERIADLEQFIDEDMYVRVQEAYEYPQTLTVDELSALSHRGAEFLRAADSLRDVAKRLVERTKTMNTLMLQGRTLARLTEELRAGIAETEALQVRAEAVYGKEVDPAARAEAKQILDDIIASRERGERLLAEHEEANDDD